MDEKDKDKIVELKKKADRKRVSTGQKDDTVSEINRAFIEDEMVRKNAQRHAESYLKDLDKENNMLPSWMWFVTGVVFTIVIEVFVLNTTIADFIVRYFWG